MSKASENWTKITRRFKATFGASSLNVTLRSLTLGARHPITGWRAKSFSESTIEMIVLPRGASSIFIVPGTYARLDAVGLTRNTVEVGDEIKTASGKYYEVKAVREHPFEWYFECDLTLLSLHD